MAPPASAEIDPFEIEGPRLYIRREERDRLVLSAGSWPQAAATALGARSRWSARGDHLFRHLLIREESGRRQELWEALLRFPNAPVYGTHQVRRLPFDFAHRWPNYHTMRIIGYGPGPQLTPEGLRAKQIRHVYLLHNGLNETSEMLFHYRLAAWILNRRSDAVCILRPLPGHLTRFPHHGLYADQPLDTFLRDPADVFRQFLRHMLETQWLLSALVPRSEYRVVAGARLLAERRPKRADPQLVGRATDLGLARAVAREWREAMDRSEIAAAAAEETESDATQPSRPMRTSFSRDRINSSMVRDVVSELRALLGWRPVRSADGPNCAPANGRAGASPEPPYVHVVGYSIGGFMAQAVFFAWPSAVASCTNMFAGGALRDLAPTAFAHREEWQAVLHGMRYELDRAYRDGFLDVEGGRVAGIDEGDFDYFTRVFYEVFLQYYRGGYSSRLSEFSRRMLFVVGGDDPIVRTRNVLDAGPSSGMTLFQIADVSHFPSGRAHGDDEPTVEDEQREFWLPQVGRMISAFSEQSARTLHRTLSECWGACEDPTEEAMTPPADADVTPMLESTTFAWELGRLVNFIGSGGEGESGWLLVGRNELPPLFLGPTAFRFHGQAVHHSEELIVQYVRLLAARAAQLERPEHRDRVTLLIPDSRYMWFRDEWRRSFFSKSETPNAARIPSEADAREMWDTFRRRWIAHGAVRMVRAAEYRGEDLEPAGPAEVRRLRADMLSLAFLPDVWIALSAEACSDAHVGPDDAREQQEQAIVDWAAGLVTRGGANEVRLKRWMETGQISAIAVSGAELNPRYRGRRLVELEDVRKALVHWALAYSASRLAS
jgi:hypothetical protein